MSLQVSWAAPLIWTGSADFSWAPSACLWQLAGWRQRRLTATCHYPVGSPELVHRVAAGLQKKPAEACKVSSGLSLEQLLFPPVLLIRASYKAPLDLGGGGAAKLPCKGRDQREGSLCSNLWQVVTGIGCIWNSDPSVGDTLIAYETFPRWKGRGIIIKMIKAWNLETEVQILALTTCFCNPVQATYLSW